MGIRKSPRPTASTPKSIQNSRRKHRFIFNPNDTFGKGGFGTVYRCIDQITNEFVAIKICTLCENEKEAEALLRLRGVKCVIELIDYHQTNDRTQMFVMKAAHGGELFKRVQSHGFLNESDAKLYFTQMLDGVKGMHTRGVIHRDLKLENVVFTEIDSDTLYWIDLGLACVFATVNTPGIDDIRKPETKLNGQTDDGCITRRFHVKDMNTVVGSEAYIAPESLDNATFDGFKADVWALGVCLFAMVVGYFPVEVAKRSNKKLQIIAEAQERDENGILALFVYLSRPCKLSKSLVDFLNTLLQVNPMRRPNTHRIEASDWLYT